MAFDPVAGEANKHNWPSILARIAGGDRHAFSLLYDGFAGRLKGFLLQRGASESTAEEVLQQAFLQIWQRADQFTAAAGSAEGWLFRIVRNAYIDHLRKRQVSDRVAPLPATETQELVIDDGRSHLQVRKALKQLPSRQAQVLFMSFYQGKTHSEIATELEIPLGSVKSSLRLAFEKLRRCLGEPR